MRADPEPDYYFFGLQTQGPPTDPDTDRVDGTTLAHKLELQTGVEGVLLPEAIVLTCQTLYTCWEPPEAESEVFGEM